MDRLLQRLGEAHRGVLRKIHRDARSRQQGRHDLQVERLSGADLLQCECRRRAADHRRTNLLRIVSQSDEEHRDQCSGDCGTDEKDGAVHTGSAATTTVLSPRRGSLVGLVVVGFGSFQGH